MPTIERFEDLEAWRVAREVARDVYRLSRQEHFARDFGLRNQICRSAVSVMSNIAEGFERDGKREFVNFLSIAKGSSGELRSQLYIALDQRYISKEQFEGVCDKTLQNCRLISGLIKYLNNSEVQGQKFRFASKT
jgi:four helix bundle protein